MHTIPLPVGLLAPPDVLYAAAIENPQSRGLDAGWTPNSLHEAIYELVLEGSPLVRIAPHEKATFCIEMDVILHEGTDVPSLRAALAAHGQPPNLPLECALLAALMLPVAPIDMGLEIVKVHTPRHTSAHARMALWQQAKAACEAGRPGGGSF